MDGRRPQLSTPVPQSQAQNPQREAFVELVRLALGQLHSRALLQTNALCAYFPGEGAAPAAQRLEEALLEALRALRPAGASPRATAEWRQFRYLWLRYVEGVRLDDIAATLGVTDRQARRDHRDGLEVVAANLWTRCHGSPWSAEVPSDPAETGLLGEVSEDAAALEAELSTLEKESGRGPSWLPEAVEATVAAAARLLDNHKRRVELALMPDLPPLAVNHSILRQILMNLLVYTVRATPDGPVRVSAEANAEGMVVRVQGGETIQQGVGGRAPDSLGEEVEETLSLSRRMVEHCGGSLVSQSSAAASAEITIQLPSARLATVLVVDDNADFLRLCQRYLDDTAYRAITTRLAREVVAIARQYSPDAIVHDVLMPGQDGWELLATLKRDEQTRDIPVVVCSVMREPRLALELGASAFVPKPLTRLSLLTTLDQVLAKQRADRESP